jgi:hypothetical protein
MTATFVSLMVVVLWPLVLSATAGVLAMKALAETDELSDVVAALTQPKRDEENALRSDSSLRDRPLSAKPGHETKPLRKQNRGPDRAAVRRLLREHALLE